MTESPVSAANIAAGIADWVQTMQAAGVQPIIYSGSAFWNDNVKVTTES